MSKTKKKAKRSTVFVIERKAGLSALSEADLDDTVMDHDDEEFGEEQESYVAVAACPDRPSSEAALERFEREIRESFPPAAVFRYSLPIPDKILHAGIQALGLTPPTKSKDEYEAGQKFKAWWQEHAAELSHDQKRAIWDLFSGCRFYRIREIPIEE